MPHHVYVNLNTIIVSATAHYHSVPATDTPVQTPEQKKIAINHLMVTAKSLPY